MVGDREVVDLLLRELLKKQYHAESSSMGSLEPTCRWTASSSCR
jgi:hypothetical protein